MKNLKQKTITGITWSFIEFFSRQGFTFIIGIILARLLSPKEFGLVGLAAIFIAISRTLVDSGFSQALVRKKNCTQIDYSTVFYFNVIIGIIIYLALMLLSGEISRFFGEPELEGIVEVLGLGVIINSFAVVQLAKLTKEMNFKLQTKISILSAVISGITGVVMAYQGHGVWSLIVKSLSGFIITTILLWLFVKWRPSFVFSMKSFNEMFSFGSKLLINGLLNSLYTNIYLIVIGKYYSAIEVGFYTRADQFKKLLSENISSIIQRVSYPALSTIQDDIPRLKIAYQILIKSTMFIVFILMMTMAAVAKPMVLVLIGEKWLPSVEYLQLLCFAGMFYPIHAINLNMLLVKGDSGLFLKLSIIRKLFVVPVILIGIYWGIKFMIVGMIFNSVIFLFINSYYSGKYIGYSSWSQMKDIFPSFIIALLIAIIVYLCGMILTIQMYWVLLIQLLIGFSLSCLFGELFHVEGYKYIKNILLKSKSKMKNSM